MARGAVLIADGEAIRSRIDEVVAEHSRWHLTQKDEDFFRKQAMLWMSGESHTLLMPEVRR